MPGAPSDHRFDPLPLADARTVTAGETVLVLVPRPGDEAIHCGGLIAQCCRRGRPPIVMVLGDGTSTDPAAPPALLAASHARETSAACACLGLDRERLLMAGILDAQLAGAGPVFEAAIRAVIAVMWRQDCNVVCAPAGPRAPDAMAGQVASHVAHRSGVGLLHYAGPGWRPDELGAERWHLDTTAMDIAARHAAIQAHASRAAATGPAGEVFFRPKFPTP